MLGNGSYPLFTYKVLDLFKPIPSSTNNDQEHLLLPITVLLTVLLKQQLAKDSPGELFKQRFLVTPTRDSYSAILR